MALARPWMPCPACDPANEAAPASAPPSCTPTRPTTAAGAAGSAGPAASAPRIARKGVETSARLGRHRWVVERTFAWLAQFRRLAIRFERRADIHLAFTTLAAALICLNQIRRFC